MPPKGQSFTPQHIPRAPGTAQALQHSYQQIPGQGFAQAPVPVQQPVQAPLQPQPLPLDPTYIANVGAAIAEYQRQEAALKYAALQNAYEFGFDDESNPYSRKKMLQRAYEMGQKGNINAQASRGQLYSGGAQAEQDEGTYQHGRSYDALRREYTGNLNNLIGQAVGLPAQLAQTWGGEYGQMIDRSLQLRPEVGAVPSSYTTPAAPRTAPKPKQVARPKKIPVAKKPTAVFKKKPQKKSVWGSVGQR